MNVYNILNKKKRGEELSEEEILFFSRGFVDGTVPDYQASALLMAICINGMTDRETAALTYAIEKSGDVVDLSAFGDLTVDKHSTGGVGDKTTLLVAPIVASLGCKVAKMSGRGLGHTGGTVDKLESLPGYSVALSADEFLTQVGRIGIAVTGQSGNLAPLDKKLYALRDVTATVDSIPLITSSIMGKKLAAGSRSIVLDVKYGSGSFMKTPDSARALAEGMVRIGKMRGRNISAIITDMDKPLGRAIGNSLEMKEAIAALKGEGPTDLTEVSVALATEMAALALSLDRTEAEMRVRSSIDSGAALKKQREWLTAQGADPAYVDDPDLLPSAPLSYSLIAEESGYITGMNTELIGLSSVALGGGRMTKDDLIDYSAGILLEKKTGDKIERGDLIATLYSSDESKLSEGTKILRSAITLGKECPEPSPLIYDIII